MSLRLAPWLALALLGLAACTAKPSSPAALSGAPTLGVTPAAPPSAALEGPVRVTFHAPEGETDAQLEISVSFDRPMVPLGTEVEPAPGTLTIEPPLAGRTRWVGSQTLLFEPSAPAPMGTTYRARVAAGVRALDGRELAEPVAFTFSTPALAIARVDPRSGAEGEPRDRAIELTFNQPVTPGRLREHARLEVSADGRDAAYRQAPFRVEPVESDARRLRIRADSPYPLGAGVRLRVRAGLAGGEGPRALASDFEARFRVVGPLRLLASAPCRGDDCIPRLSFTNPVHTRALRAQLRFDPPLARPLPDEEDYTSEELYFGAELAPNTTYRVRVEGELRDVYGNSLVGERAATVKTPPYPALARLLLEGEIMPFESAGARPLRVQLQNLRDAKLTLSPLAASELSPLAPSVKGKDKPIVHVLGAAGPVERRVVEIDAAPALRSGKGAFLATLSARGEGQALKDQRLIVVTELSATLKAGPSGGLVWVTRLADARPVAGASVRILRGTETVASGTSDGAGLFNFSLPRPRRRERDDYASGALAVVVEKDGDVTFTRKYDGVGPWQLTERAGDAGAGQVAAHLFTERGVYRPGDTLQLTGILRTTTRKGLAPTPGEVEVWALDASGREIERARAQLSAYGTFTYALRVPGSIELGPLALRVRHGASEFTASAEVAEYKPAELELSLRTTREQAIRGEREPVRVEGRYLFGAPARDGVVFWSARYRPRDFAPPGYEGFRFDDTLARDEGEAGDDALHAAGASGDGKLDAMGSLRFEVPLDGAPANGPALVEIEASVSAGGAHVSTRTALATVPAAVLAGVRPAASLVAAGEPLHVDLVALSASGSPLRDVGLEAELLRREYKSEQVEGRMELRAHDRPVGRCKKTSAVQPVRCRFETREPGLHVARVRTKDRAGRLSVASVPLYVYGAGQAFWESTGGPVVALKAERQKYALGETAKVLVPSPFAEAEALITVERDGVLTVEQQRLGPAGTIDVRIDERFVPNAFVSVLLLRPARAAEPVADGGPPFRVGAIELSADVSVRKLSVDVQPDGPDKRPGEELTVRLAVRDGAGKETPAELTVFAVDEGVLSLTGYRTPDPFAAIYAPRALALWTADGRGDLARLLAPEEDKGGGEGGGGGESVRSHFASVAVFAPRIETDQHGRAELRFKLPDATTRYRIMAVAASRGAEVGSGEGFVRTHKPVMLRALVPRVLRAGDRAALGVVVHNNLGEPLRAEVALEASGLTRVGEPKQRVSVDPGGTREVRFTTQADRVGEAKLRFSVRGEGKGAEQDALALSRPVLSPSVIETVSVAGESTAEASEGLAPLTGVREDVGGLEVTLASSALAELEAPARTLLAYEYGCTEQLSSRLIALSALSRLQQPLALADAGLAGLVETLAAELERHQNPDGSFGMWRAHDGTPAVLARFLTGYALLALSELERAGLGVSRLASERAKEFLATSLRTPPTTEQGSEAHRSEQAFSVYALARAGRTEGGYAQKLLEERTSLSTLARIELAHALALDPPSRAQGDGLLNEIASAVRVTADEAHLETGDSARREELLVSDVRATSALVLMLLDHAPTHVLLPKLARWLASARGRDGSWSSTQESAWALMALAAYHGAKESVPPRLDASVQLGRRTLGRAHLEGARARASFHLPMRELPDEGAPLRIARTGTGPLYYVLRLGYTPRELPSTPRERGFFVERSYERIDPAALARGDARGEVVQRAEVGDYVRVTLRVAVPSTRRFVLLVDPLPAGLEPVDFALATEGQGAASALRDRAPHDHYELRDDRAVFAVNELPPGLYRYSYLTRASTAGDYVAPPTRIEEMYHPETQGLTAATRFAVSAR